MASPQKNLYLISAECKGWDVYVSAVVVSDTIENSKCIHPNKSYEKNWKTTGDWKENRSWATHPRKVKSKFIGIADASLDLNDVICAKYISG